MRPNRELLASMNREIGAGVGWLTMSRAESRSLSVSAMRRPISMAVRSHNARCGGKP